MEETYGTLLIRLKGIKTPVRVFGVQKETSEKIHGVYKHFIKYKGKKNDGYVCVTFDNGEFVLNLAEVQMLNWYRD